MLRLIPVALYGIVLGLVSLIITPLFDRKSKYSLNFARIWCKFTLWIFRIPVTRVGEPKRSDKPLIIVCNHQSNLDIPPLLATVPQPAFFILKKILAAIPFWGWAVIYHMVPVDRNKRDSGRRSLDRAIEKIKAGNNLVIFPEGTRSRTGRLGAFKMGAFKIATLGIADMAVYVLQGTRELLPPGSRKLKSGPVSLTCIGTIPSEEMVGVEPGVIRDRVHAMMSSALGEDAPASVTASA